MLRRDSDFAAFERVLLEAHEREPLRILVYRLMGNHSRQISRGTVNTYCLAVSRPNRPRILPRAGTAEMFGGRGGWSGTLDAARLKRWARGRRARR